MEGRLSHHPEPLSKKVEAKRSGQKRVNAFFRDRTYKELIARQPIDASRQFDFEMTAPVGGRERSSAEWGDSALQPARGMAELGG